MKPQAVFFIAIRYLLGRGREAGRYLRGAVFGIALSLVPIITTLVVADGMIFGITERFLELSSYHYQIYSRNYSTAPEEALEIVEGLAGVRAVWPEIQGLGLVVGAKASVGASVRAVDPDFLNDSGVRRYLELKAGELSLNDAKAALVGEALAKKTGLKPGDTARLMVVQTNPDGRKIPKVALFTVKGIVASGYQELDALWFFIPYKVGQELLPVDSVRPFLGVKVENPYREKSVRANLESLLPKNFVVYSWYDLQRSKYLSYETTRQLLLLIMFLAVLVAAINVSSATSMLVVERRKDIAILKSAGASQKSISAVFIMAAGLTGVAGTLIGTAAGLLTAVNINNLIRGLEFIVNLVNSGLTGLVSRQSDSTIKILDPAYYLQTIPIIINWATISLITSGAVLFSIVAAWLPARRAGQLLPLEILRKY